MKEFAPPVDDTNWGKTEVGLLGEQSVSVSLRPPQNPHGLARDKTRSSVVTGRRLSV